MIGTHFTGFILPEGEALLSGMDAGATAGQRGIVDSWDIFDDGCRSGYLEYRADGGFGQVYRRNRADWLVDPTWSEPSGATGDSDPFFEVLFNCADDETSVTGIMPEAAPDEEPLPVERARAEESTLDEMLFDADMARVSRIIAASKSRCMVEGERPEAAAECIDHVGSALDISGDGLLSLSEIARRHRFAEYLREASADHSDDHAVRALEPHSHGQNP